MRGWLGRLARTIVAAIAAFAEFERELMLERQRDGIAEAKAEGRCKGRKPTAMAKADEVKWHGLPSGAATFRMNMLTTFGLLSVSAMLVFYALEDRSSWFTLCFAGACALGSAYGFLQGAWPFGIVELIWAGVAVRRWRMRIKARNLSR